MVLSNPFRLTGQTGYNRFYTIRNYSGGGLEGRSPFKQKLFSLRLGGEAAQTERKRGFCGGLRPPHPHQTDPLSNYGKVDHERIRNDNTRSAAARRSARGRGWADQRLEAAAAADRRGARSAQGVR